jgi:hypothetical protein
MSECSSMLSALPIIDLAGRRIKRTPVLDGLINEYEAA